jgi:O-antigen/teichoic acid export membrane protein
MKEIIYKNILKILSFFYEKAFKQKMGDDVAILFKNLSYVGFATIIATIFSFSFNILSARVLGPEGYGQFALIQTIAFFLIVPMTFGIGTALTKYTSENENFQRQRTIISTAYILEFIFIISCITIYLIFSSQISKVISVSTTIFYLSIIFATFYVFYILTTTTLTGLLKMKEYGIFTALYNIVLLLVFLIFILINFISVKSMIISLCFAYGLIGGIIVGFIRKYLFPKFDKDWGRHLTKYGGYATIGGTSSAIYSHVAKIFINKYMTIAYVGLYYAYNYSMTMALTFPLQIIVTVFLPFASKSRNKDIIFKRITKILPLFLLISFPVLIISGFIILFFYGNKYPFDLKLASLFAIAGICIFTEGIYGQLMNSVGKKGIRLTSFAAILMALTNISLNIYLIPLIGLEGAVIATIVSYTISIIIILSRKRYFYHPEEIKS